MKTFGKIIFLPLVFGLVLWAAAAMAGEAGTVSCATPDCGYQHDLKIGGGMRSPRGDGVLPIHQKICPPETQEL